MTFSYGVTLTTHDKSGTQKKYHTIIYSNPATISSIALNDAGGIGVLGTSYGTAAVPNWSLVNLSTITGTTGVYLENGGSVDNAATVAGSGIFGTVGSGVIIQRSVGTVTNLGTILASATTNNSESFWRPEGG